MYEYPYIDVPNTDLRIQPGSKVRLGRFDSTVWVVSHGWYSWGNNRPVCGWFLTECGNPEVVKPLQRTDLDDIYFVEM